MKLVAISNPWSYSNNLIATIKSFIIYNIKIKIISSFTYDHKTVVIRLILLPRHLRPNMSQELEYFFV